MLLHFLLAAGVAAAGDPTVTITGDGTVEARVVLPPSSRTHLDAMLRDATTLAALSPEVLSIETEPRGDCVEVTRRTKGLFRPLELRALRCPTASGWRESLVEPGDFTEYATEWRVTDTASGTEVVYRVRTAVDLAVPDAVLRRTLATSSRELLAKLAREVVGR